MARVPRSCSRNRVDAATNPRKLVATSCIAGGMRRIQLCCTEFVVTPTRCLRVISGRRATPQPLALIMLSRWFVVRLAIGLSAPERDGRRIATALRVLVIPTRLEPGCLSCTIWTELGEDFRVHYEERWCSEQAMRQRVLSDAVHEAAGSARGVAAPSHGGIRFRVEAHGTRLRRERAQRLPDEAGEMSDRLSSLLIAEPPSLARRAPDWLHSGPFAARSTHGMPETAPATRGTCTRPALGPPTMFRRTSRAALGSGHSGRASARWHRSCSPPPRGQGFGASAATEGGAPNPGDDEPMRHLLQAASMALCITAQATAQPAATDPMPPPQPPASASAVVPPLVCESAPGGGRQQCPADTSKGVALTRSTGSGECILGRTWGYDQVSIWVSEGCGGEFLVGAAAVAAAAQAHGCAQRRQGQRSVD